jgi:hypothetical protein
MATIKKPVSKMQKGGKLTGKEKEALMEKYKTKNAIADNYDLFMKGKFESPKQKLDNISKLRSGAKKDSISASRLKKGGVVKAKNGKSFPDLNKDGKITKADILKGRGVIAKKGATLKKQAAVAIAMKKAGKAPKKMQYGGAAASMVPPMMKKGGTTKKCKYGCK